MEYFAICGLGSLGQHCVTALTEFGVRIVAIEQQLPVSWEIESLRDLLDDLIIGDCRHNNILHRAKIEECRAALIVTTDDRVNVETAIAIRQLNPRTRLLLADIAYGYGVVPILYQQLNRTSVLLPSDEPPLKAGDRLVVLATIDGLRRIEQGKLNVKAKQWQITVETALTTDAIFEGANAIARVTGCSLTLARETMNNLPQTLPILLYQHQAQRLVGELKKALVISRLSSPR